MITSSKTKTIIFPLLFGLMMLATLVWPIHALADEPICKNELPGLSIPDSPGPDVPGVPVTSTLTVTNSALINDLNVIISTTHDYVGDLVFTLTHKIDPVLTSTVIINQPLKGQSTLPGEVSCSGDDIFVTLDDEATLDIQVNCTESLTNANDGTKAYIDGQSYRPYSPLSIFDTDTLSGTWELTINDNYQQDTGSLLGWCLVTSPNLQISKTDNEITASPGEAITYTLTYTNTGNTATGVVITETVPDNTSFNAVASSSGWQQVGTTNEYTYSVDSLLSGSGQITFVVSVSNSLPAGVNNISNMVTIGDDGTNGADQYPGDNTASETTPVQAAPDLVITKTDGGLTATPGSLITYTLTYTNEGNQDATGVVITETLPTHTSFNSGSPGWQQIGATNQYTYSVGGLNVGPSQTITFVVAVTSPLPTGVETIANTAQIGGNGSEQDLSDNQDDEVTPVTIFKAYLPIILRGN